MNAHFHDAYNKSTSYLLFSRSTPPLLFVLPNIRVKIFCNQHGVLRRYSYSLHPLDHNPPLTSLPSVEHNVPKPSTTEPSHPPRRPDLSTFFSTLEHVDTSDVSNGNALPVPGDVSAAYRTLAEAFERMRPYRSEEGPLDGMIELLVANSQAPPKEVKGVSQGFLDGECKSTPRKGWNIAPPL